ncbi:unnamed protein product, partial [Prorocentrum cordatum]
ESLSYVFDAVFWTRQQSGNEIPVIGFAGAPWTLMGYMVEGGAVRSFDRAKKWLYLYPEASRKLLTALRDIVVEYLVGQYDSGAPLLQVFDTNCGEVPPGVYEEFMVDDLKHIATEVKKRRPGALVSLFPKDGELATFNDSDYDVIGVPRGEGSTKPELSSRKCAVCSCAAPFRPTSRFELSTAADITQQVSWTTSPAEARRMCPDKTLQGNFDPYCLYADPAHVKATAQKMVREFGVD